MSSVGSVRVFLARRKPGVAKPSQWLPRSERYFVWRSASRDVLVLWKPFVGICPLSSVPAGSLGTVGINQYVNLESRKMKKLSMNLGEGVALPALPAESAVLKKFPRLCEFMVNTSYDDGSPRAPGRLWMDNDGVALTVTLFEPSGFARVRLRASTLDEAFALAERHLANEGAVWEVDQYARDRAAGKKKK